MRNFESILVANRGEIAVRIMATAQSLGYRAIAVYSEADAGAPHVRMADDAVLIGPAPVGESYLDMERILKAAAASGALDAARPVSSRQQMCACTAAGVSTARATPTSPASTFKATRPATTVSTTLNSAASREAAFAANGVGAAGVTRIAPPTRPVATGRRKGPRRPLRSGSRG